MLCAWLDSRTGAREVIDAMTDRGYNVRLSQSPFGWWAEFCRSQVSPLPKWIGRARRHARASGSVCGAGHAEAGRGQVSRTVAKRQPSRASDQSELPFPRRRAPARLRRRRRSLGGRPRHPAG
jgi:hypothetical protein